MGKSTTEKPGEKEQEQQQKYHHTLTSMFHLWECALRGECCGEGANRRASRVLLWLGGQLGTSDRGPTLGPEAKEGAEGLC